jgi:YidC/Oxa1 family membrane protein insertase
MMYLREAFDHYDTIFCTGPRHVKEIRRQEELRGLPAKNLVEAGYYRLERIYEKHKKCEGREISAHSKPAILVAPSWGDENLLESCGERLIEILIEAGYEVIVRPHPETVRRSPDLIKALRSRFEDSPDFTLETSVVTDDSLLRADALICDCSGIALEFAFGVERPVLFVDVPLKIRNPKYEELGIEPLELELRPQIGKVITPQQLDAVPRILSEFLDETAARKERLAELREQNVFAFGRSSEIGAGCIVDYLKSRR